MALRADVTDAPAEDPAYKFMAELGNENLSLPCLAVIPPHGTPVLFDGQLTRKQLVETLRRLAAN